MSSQLDEFVERGLSGARGVEMYTLARAIDRLRQDYADQTEAAGKWIARAKKLEVENERLRTQVSEMEDALLFYADPDSYSAVAFWADRPCGEFMDDFDENYTSPCDIDYDRPMPGKHARETLRKFWPATVPTGISSPEAAGFDSQAGRQDERTDE